MPGSLRRPAALRHSRVSVSWAGRHLTRVAGVTRREGRHGTRAWFGPTLHRARTAVALSLGERAVGKHLPERWVGEQLGNQIERAAGDRADADDEPDAAGAAVGVEHARMRVALEPAGEVDGVRAADRQLLGRP